ncbi:MAG: 2-oxoacid:acceptor oxidoreductase family protein [Dehalococcoidales bacterium]|nr:2-oxoacid:acceptor oxidoreductase family protein [Dehalococcoidales bacterium]
MKEIRIHGRGGQGAVLAARMLASAFVQEGKSVASFPMYGFERRGAPVVAFTRIDDKPIREKTQIYNPDCIIVIDPGLLSLPTLFTGLKPESVFILNSPKKLPEKPNDNLKIGGVVDATGIAVEVIGRDIPNTCLLGAFAAATSWLKLESILKVLPDYLSGDILQRNLKSAERGYKEVEVTKW